MLTKCADALYIANSNFKKLAIPLMEKRLDNDKDEPAWAIGSTTTEKRSVVEKR